MLFAWRVAESLLLISDCAMDILCMLLLPGGRRGEQHLEEYST